MRGLALLAAVALAAPAAAQYGPPVTPSAPDLAWHREQREFLANLSFEQGWEEIEGGVRWRRLVGSGAGPHPDLASKVTVFYSGALIDGTPFDGNFGGDPATFPLSRLVPAWQVAIPMMSVGDTIEIATPSEYGYGPRGAGPIPGGATLLFRVQLVAFEPN